MNLNTKNEVLFRIREFYDQLSKSEKQVANFVSENSDETMNLTLSSLSSLVKVSEPTIIRFCRKLNFEGYQDFKIALAKGSVYTEETLKIIHEEVEQTDSLQEIANKVINSHILALQLTFSYIDYDKYSDLLEMIVEANKIDFYGLGGSGTVAIDVENKFLRTGITTYACVDSHIQIMRSALLGERDVIIIFSNSGMTKHFINIVKNAKKNGTKTVLITSGKDTTLSKLVDLTFLIFAKETSYKKEPSSARVAMMAIMDVIVTAIALRRQGEYIENIYKTREALSSEK